MAKTVQLKLMPNDIRCEVAAGTPLRDVLYKFGVEFPCGGEGQCLGCRVKLLEGTLDPEPDLEHGLPPAEVDDGWRLACLHQADADLALQVSQWDTPILTDESSFEFTPTEGYGVAVDLGTTTLAAQLLDLRTGQVLSVCTALNPQAAHGSDVMSRISFGVMEKGQDQLRQTIRREIGQLIAELIEPAVARDVRLTSVCIVGNTPMHNIFCDIDIEPLSRYPFDPEAGDLRRFAAPELGWKLPGDPSVVFLPILGSFVGSDILAGILATGLHRSEQLNLFVDLGTNGEIVLGNRERMLCASAAAGPAFEAARIAMGMQATTGAVTEVVASADGRLHCHVLGNAEPRGICGSGLVDAAAACLELGAIAPSGRLANGEEIMLAPPVKITQKDIRELQLAKGAIAAGIHILLNQLGAKKKDVRHVYLAGAFGNYVRLASARRIGMLKFPEKKIRSVGNTALLGAKLALFMLAVGDDDFTSLSSKVEHVSLSTDMEFQEIYAEEMTFPE